MATDTDGAVVHHFLGGLAPHGIERRVRPFHLGLARGILGGLLGRLLGGQPNGLLGSQLRGQLGRLLGRGELSRLAVGLLGS